MMQMPFLMTRHCAERATELIAQYGVDAGREASSRADQSRDIGNITHFCRWRQIERMILVLENGQSGATMH